MSTRKKKDRAQAEIERAWGDTPVVDAKADLRVMITPEDLDGAITENPAQCVLARACRRMFGAEKVLFFKATAFIELPDELGVPKVERFMLGETVREVIRTFDRGEPIIPHAGVKLHAPSPSSSLEGKRKKNRTAVALKSKRERQRRRTERARAEREAQGAVAPEPGAEPEQPPPPASKSNPFRGDPVLVDVRARDGTGVVNWLRRRASRAKRSATGLGSQPRAK